jgi:hypothetical protein
MGAGQGKGAFDRSQDITEDFPIPIPAGPDLEEDLEDALGPDSRMEMRLVGSIDKFNGAEARLTDHYSECSIEHLSICDKPWQLGYISPEIVPMGYNCANSVAFSSSLPCLQPCLPPLPKS